MFLASWNSITNTKTCFENSEAMSSYAGLAAEVRTGNTWIIAITSNTILPTSLTKGVVTYSGQDEPVKSFYNHFTRVRCKTKDSPMNGEEMHLRLLAINAYKKVPPERLLAFINSAIVLFCDNGKMGTTKKSEFLEKLEGLTEPETVLMTVKAVDSIVFDVMAIIKMLPVQTSATKPTYGDMAPLFWKHVLCLSEGIQN